jgi:hypothetical protein
VGETSREIHWQCGEAIRDDSNNWILRLKELGIIKKAKIAHRVDFRRAARSWLGFYHFARLCYGIIALSDSISQILLHRNNIERTCNEIHRFDSLL